MRLSLELSKLLPSVLGFQLHTRGKASANWPLRRPRSYRRRLYDAALSPMVPKYSPFDLALVQHIRKKIRDEGYQVMGICHRLSAPQRVEWLTRNQLRLKGLEFRDYGNRIMKKVFEGTPLQPLNDTIFVATNCQLFGKNINAIKTIITECEKIDWMIPIAVVYGSQILSIPEVKQLCELPSLEDHRIQTVQLLSTPPNKLISTLSYHILDMTRILDSIKNQKKPLS
uniref:Large ribosomal subunit protein uL10m n=1 Tax=Setaria digitata TaxID=48799 RepID=A0A915PHD1_9BILA